MQKFVESYKALYKALRAPEASVEDFERWMNIATEACKAIEKILAKGNPTVGQKYSLETSLGHFINIQFELAELLKQGGEVQSGPEASEVEDVSSEVGSQAEDSTTKWVEISSALKCRIKKRLNRER